MEKAVPKAVKRIGSLSLSDGSGYTSIRIK
jgi:hypothetical protein